MGMCGACCCWTATRERLRDVELQQWCFEDEPVGWNRRHGVICSGAREERWGCRYLSKDKWRDAQWRDATHVFVLEKTVKVPHFARTAISAAHALDDSNRSLLFSCDAYFNELELYKHARHGVLAVLSRSVLLLSADSCTLGQRSGVQRGSGRGCVCCH